MARFILDVDVDVDVDVDEKARKNKDWAEYDNEIDRGIMKVLKACCDENLMGGSVTISCIDKTTDNQFYIDDEDTKYTDNKLSKKQVDNYNKILGEL